MYTFPMMLWWWVYISMHTIMLTGWAYNTKWPWSQMWSAVTLRCHNWFLESTECTVVEDFHHGGHGVGQRVHRWEHRVRQEFYGTSLCLGDFTMKSKLLFKKGSIPSTHMWLTTIQSQVIQRPLLAFEGTACIRYTDTHAGKTYTQIKTDFKILNMSTHPVLTKFSMKIYKVLDIGNRTGNGQIRARTGVCSWEIEVSVHKNC